MFLRGKIQISAHKSIDSPMTSACYPGSGGRTGGDFARTLGVAGVESSKDECRRIVFGTRF
jgi:hypothetical protein